MSEHTEQAAHDPLGEYHETHELHEHHVAPASHFWGTYIFLLIMLFATVGAAFFDLHKYIPVPGMNIIVMLFIAILKATAVVLIFMEVRKGTRLVWLWAGAGFFWFLMMLGILVDYLTRTGVSPVKYL
jgi:caa(3)-type oxidase subunit IV